MDLRELAELLSDLESHRAERKESAKDKDKIQQATCAFANDLSKLRQPGVLFVGVDDNGAPTGLPITDGLLLDLSQIRDSGNILPIPSMSVEKVQLKGADIAVVIVERRLAEKRRYHDPSFDLWPVPEARLTDLDLRFINDDYLPAAIDAETLEANKRSIEDRLRSLRLLRIDSAHAYRGRYVDCRQVPAILPARGVCSVFAVGRHGTCASGTGDRQGLRETGSGHPGPGSHSGSSGWLLID